MIDKPQVHVENFWSDVFDCWVVEVHIDAATGYRKLRTTFLSAAAAKIVRECPLELDE